MKYTQYSRKRNGSSAFYIVIALCLVLIGVAAWFAFTRIDNNNMQRDASSIESKVESKTDEYKDDFESYIESEPSKPQDNMPNNEIQQNNTPMDQTASAETEKVKAYTMPVNGEILKDFSSTALQYSATYNDMRIHAGVDIACSEGTIVSAAADGIVKEIENSAEYGKTVTIDHGDGLIIKYAGLKNITAEKDTAVKMGDNIGAVSTVPCECSDQSHLHIETFLKGKAISILQFFE